MENSIKVLVFKDILEDLRTCRWRIPEDFLQFSHFCRVVRDLDWNSSPGYPYMLNKPNNRQFFEVENGEPNMVCLQRVYEMVKFQIENRAFDPIRTFIKPEPITKAKYEKCKFRIISSVSIIDQIIDHMLFGDFNNQLVLNCHRTPVKTGWTPILGGWKEVPKSNIVSTDKSSWDWTVHKWLLDAELEIRYLLCDNMREDWKDLAIFRYRSLFDNPTFVTSGGILLKQKVPGVMKSGCVNTIASNSIMQMILHYRVARELGMDKPFMWAMGDDVIQEDVPQEYFDKLSEFCILKEISRHIEFAGYRYKGMMVEPLYFGKHAFMLRHQKEQFHEETADAYALLYHRSNRRSIFRKILSVLNKELVKEDILDLLWDME